MKFKAAVKIIINLLRLFPVNSTNYLQYCRQHYGTFICDTSFQYGKVRLQLNKTKLDLKFLKQCKREKLLPKFVRFRLSQTFLRHRSTVNACYFQFLLNEIKLKKRKLSSHYHHLNRLKHELSINTNIFLYARITTIIDNRVKELESNVTPRHERKLTCLRAEVRPPNSPTSHSSKYPKEPVRDLTKKLTPEQIEVLSNGLDFVSPYNKLDEETFICNIEAYFYHHLGRTTDKKDYERKGIDEKTSYKLSADQLQAGNKIRTAANNFLHKARQQPKLYSKQKIQTNKILQQLKKDKSMVITKADKGRAVVVMERQEYIKKMMKILDDPKKFKLINEDPTVKQEEKVVRKLRQLLERKFISEEEFKRYRPSGSQPSRLYGLPKIHKDEIPLRPILSASGSFNYGISKLLLVRLSSLQKHPTVIEDPFKFVDELHSLDIDMNEHLLISFDVINLFTEVPLKQTTEIILNEKYGITCECKIIKKKPSYDDSCAKCKDRTNLKWLLDTATRETHFLFDGNIYQQEDGISMGSCLGPFYANMCLNDLVKEKMTELEQAGVIYFKRYVDDTFTIIKKDADLKRILNILNSYHPNIQFTKEEEKNNTLAFLDISITRLSSKTNTWFSTTIYRKNSFTGLMLKYSSFVPFSYKRSAVSSMIYRATRICSTYPLMHIEFDTIREIASANGYPLPFIEKLICKVLDRHYEMKNKQSSTKMKSTSLKQTEKLKRSPLLVDIPYIGRPTISLGKKLISISKQFRPDIVLQPIQRPLHSIQTFFPKKCPLPKEVQSGIVYNIHCHDCDASYIGKTWRQATVRHAEHGAPSRPILSRQKLPSTQPLTTTSSDPLRRSSRIKKKAIGHIPKQQQEQESNTTAPIDSAIYDHQQQTGHAIDWNDWKILRKDNHHYRLSIRETLAIQRYQPSLNKTVQSVPLVIFPMGLKTKTTKVKMKH